MSAVEICPRDGHPLTHRDVVGIEFFSCKTCHGLWFGPEALFEFGFHVAQGGSMPWSLASERPPILEGTARCLCEGRPLMKPREKNGVTLDECPACKGIWLDGGEVESILRSHPGMANSLWQEPYRARMAALPGPGAAVGEAIFGIGEAILEVIGGFADLG